MQVVDQQIIRILEKENITRRLIDCSYKWLLFRALFLLILNHLHGWDVLPKSFLAKCIQCSISVKKLLLFIVIWLKKSY
jgi:hypothetical protein